MAVTEHITLYDGFVYVGYEKNDTAVYATPLAAVVARIDSTYEYEDQEVLLEAFKVVAMQDQGKAWKFLMSRSDYEYERIDRVQLVHNIYLGRNH